MAYSLHIQEIWGSLSGIKVIGQGHSGFQHWIFVKYLITILAVFSLLDICLWLVEENERCVESCVNLKLKLLQWFILWLKYELQHLIKNLCRWCRVWYFYCLTLGKNRCTEWEPTSETLWLHSISCANSENHTRASLMRGHSVNHWAIWTT